MVSAAMAGKRKRSNNQLAPAKVEEIKSLLVAGNGVLEIANKVTCSATTVQRIRQEIKERIPTWRERTIKSLTKLHTDVVADIQENYKRVPPGQKGILLGILSDKIANLNQDNSATVTHNHLHISHRDINSLFTDKRPPDNRTGATRTDSSNPARIDTTLDA